MKPKLLLIWHEAGNSAYWDRFRALSELFDLQVFGLRQFQGVTFVEPTTQESFQIELYGGFFRTHWLTFISLRMLYDVWRADCDLIYLHEEPHAITSFMVSLLKRGRVLFLDSAVINLKGNFSRLNLIEQFVYRAIDGFFSRNDEVLQMLQTRGCDPAKNLGILGNGVSPSLFVPGDREVARSRLLALYPEIAAAIEPGKLLIGFAGRIWSPKGIAIFIDILKVYSCKVIVCGPVTDRRLAERLRKNGITVLPRLEGAALRDFYTSLDLFVLPSLPTRNWREQFGRVLIESIYCGTPALGSRTGGIPQIVGSEATFAPGDIPDLISLLDTYRQEEARTRLLKSQSDTVALNFTWDRIAARVRSAFDKLSSDRRLRVRSSPNKVAIFQNYYAPYRAALFEKLGESWDLTLLYMHQPGDEGRKWKASPPQRFRSIDATYTYLGKVLFFSFARSTHLFREADCIILLDDNPSNLTMIWEAILLRLVSRKRVLVWVEHIPDRSKPRLKELYQSLCTKVLVTLSDGVLAFSAMTQQYLASIRVKQPVYRVSQAVPSPSMPLEVPQPRTKIRKFGYLGSNSPRKNLPALLAAFRQIDIDGLELHIAGIEPPTDKSEAGKIYWHGYVEGMEKERFFDTIDALVLPSIADPWGLVVNEALNRFRIALVSGSCGSSEVVRQIDPELVFKPTVAGIRRSLEFAASLDEARLYAMAQAIPDVMRAYSLETSAAQISGAIRGQRFSSPAELP